MAANSSKYNYPEELINNFKQNKEIFFVGAGISSQAGLPSWPGLIENLIQLASEKTWCSEQKINEYKALVKDGENFLLLAEELKTDLGRNFHDYIEKTFGNPAIEPPEVMFSIFDLNPQIIITTNYDRIIENAFTRIHSYSPPTFTYTQNREIANNFWKEKFFVLKAHGDAFEDVQQIILSQRDYRKTLYRELGYKSILQAIFSSKSVFFVGTSMTDPEFKLLLDYLHESYLGGGPKHYLLVESSKTNPILQRRFDEEFSIETLTYENTSGKHAEVNEYLKGLKLKIEGN